MNSPATSPRPAPALAANPFLASTKVRCLRWLGHQDWLPLEARRRVIKKFVNHNTVGSQEFETDFYGLRYRGNLAELIDWFVFFFGAYEKEELSLLQDLAAGMAAPVFLDIGASIGQHSLFMSRCCREIHAFEPYAPARQRFREKMALNNLRHVFLHKVALGAREEELEFYAPVGPNIGVGSFRATHRQKHQPIGKLKVVRGDDYLRHLNLPTIDIIKIDVEGFENEVLAGLAETITKFRPYIIMELAAYNIDYFFREKDYILLPEYTIQKISPRNPLFSMGKKYALATINPQQASLMKTSMNILLSPK